MINPKIGNLLCFSVENQIALWEYMGKDVQHQGKFLYSNFKRPDLPKRNVGHIYNIHFKKEYDYWTILTKEELIQLKAELL